MKETLKNNKTIIGIIIGMLVLMVVLCTLIVKALGKENAGSVTASQQQNESIEQGQVSTPTDAVNTLSDTEVSERAEQETTLQESPSKPVSPTKPAISTGTLTEFGNGYEGIEGTGKYNYGEALQKSLLFYELQRSGELPPVTRCNWRGDSAMDDGKDVGLDLTGGWFDAGDNVKFNLPMAYSSSILGWSILEDYDAYKESGQLEYALSNVRWANDYFMKCHPEDEVYYYQVGNGGQDHSYWGAAETVAYKMERPSYCVTKQNPGSTVCGETAASLAISSIVFAQTDKKYSALCLEHAKSLYEFARSTRSDSGYTAAAGFYDSWSGWNDELAWAGVWLYKATGEEKYLTNAKADYEGADQNHKWAMCWDDVHIGAALLLARETGDSKYARAVEEHLNWWTTGDSNGDKITYTPKGLAWLDSWGSLRYATTTGYIATVYSSWDGCDDAKKKTYWEFAENQMNYALGDTGFSYEIGFGKDYPKNPHHRTAQGSYCDNMNEPQEARHTLYGALVGGPDAGDNYRDEVSNYTNNEVACDYNAGFTALLAKMYGKYHGQTLVDFGAVEEVTENELFARGGINVEGQDFVELRVYVCNTSAWPARVPQQLEYRYYIDLSEVYAAGGSAADIVVSSNYMQGGSEPELVCWDDEKHIYYMVVKFDGTAIYPGGQDAYKKEIQIRIRNQKGVWDNENDPSFAGMTMGGNEILSASALYEAGELVFGREPGAGDGAGQKVEKVNENTDNKEQPGNQTDKPNNQTTPNNNQTPVNTSNSASGDRLSVSVKYDNLQASATSIAGSMDIKNAGSDSIDISKLKIYYYFTNEEGKGLTFNCYHAAINGKNGAYGSISNCSGSFENATGQDTDTACVIIVSDSKTLETGDTLSVNFCINHSDWSFMTTTNDYSVKSAENIVIVYDGQQIFGTSPK